MCELNKEYRECVGYCGSGLRYRVWQYYDPDTGRVCYETVSGCCDEP